MRLRVLMRGLTSFLMVCMVIASLVQAAEADSPDLAALERRIKKLEDQSNSEPFLKLTDVLSVLFGGLGGGFAVSLCERRRLANLKKFKLVDFEPYRKALVEQLDELKQEGPSLVDGMQSLLTSYMFVGGQRPRGQTFERDETQIEYFKKTRLPKVSAECPKSGYSETKQIREDCTFINVHVLNANAQLEGYSILLSGFSMYDENGVKVRLRFGAADNDELRINPDFLEEVNQAQTAFTDSVKHIMRFEQSISKELATLQVVL